MNQALNVFIGALISLFTIVWIERKRLPVLKVRIEIPTIDLTYDSASPAVRHRALRLIIENQALRSHWRWWLARSAAVNCSATITFHHLDGQDVFGRSMGGRWAKSPQPVPLVGMVGNERFVIFDHTRFTLESRIDIFPSDHTELDVAARFDNDQEAYGWSNESYFSNPTWRPPQWKLAPGRYLVRVRVRAANAQCAGLFRLINDVPISDFRLERALPTDHVTG